MKSRNLIFWVFLCAISICFLIFFTAKVRGEDFGGIRSAQTCVSKIDPIGDTDTFNFYGHAGDTVVIVVSETSGGAFFVMWVELYDPDGLKETDGFDISNHQLLKSGLYTIVCSDQINDDVGEYNLSFSKIPLGLPGGVYNPDPANGALVSPATEMLDWVDTFGATQYKLYVQHEGAPLPLINRVVTSSSYHLEEYGAYILDHNRFNWNWKVRACVDGNWCEWSEERSFDVEPVNTDPPLM